MFTELFLNGIGIWVSMSEYNKDDPFAVKSESELDDILELYGIQVTDEEKEIILASERERKSDCCSIVPITQPKQAKIIEVTGEAMAPSDNVLTITPNKG